MQFAHLTDIHLPIGARPPISSILNKRVLGYLSWSRRRRRLHQQWAADALVADIMAQDVGAAIISGDLVNIALPEEFKDARDWLDEHFGDLPAIFAPGNHDTYVRTDWSETLGLLAPYMQGMRLGEQHERSANAFDDFPFEKKFAAAPGVSFIVANSAPSTAPGLASGRLGEAQLGRIRTMLQDAGARGDFRVLALHHPINAGVVGRRKALDDLTELQAVLSEVGVDLVLHGHAHVPLENSVDTPQGPAPVFGGGSASHPFGHGKYQPARYNLFSVKRDDGGAWKLSLTIRELNAETRAIETVAEQQYTRATSAAR